MADNADLNERDAKLVQWLAEAHAKEAELEADLTAHIALTEKESYKRRLQQHLNETHEHKRRVSARIEQIGGPTESPIVPNIPRVAGEAAGKAIAAIKGQVDAARALLTEQAETHLRNAQEELREEHVEIALYTRLETLATEVGDRDTAQLARSIKREEERMAKFLEAELQRLVKDVVRAEIPRDQRRSPRSRSATRPSRTARSRPSQATRPSEDQASRSSSRRSGPGRAPRSNSSRTARSRADSSPRSGGG
jgi:ferritin-like metal-binding protein YciE